MADSLLGEPDIPWMKIDRHGEDHHREGATCHGILVHPTRPILLAIHSNFGDYEEPSAHATLVELTAELSRSNTQESGEPSDSDLPQHSSFIVSPDGENLFGKAAWEELHKRRGGRSDCLRRVHEDDPFDCSIDRTSAGIRVVRDQNHRELRRVTISTDLAVETVIAEAPYDVWHNIFTRRGDNAPATAHLVWLKPENYPDQAREHLGWTGNARMNAVALSFPQVD